MNRLTGHVHRWWVLPVAVAVSLPITAPGSSSPVQAQATPVTLTFEFTGGPQTLTIPEGVTGDATFDVYGAQGGSRTFAGGLGGRAMATFPISAGMTSSSSSAVRAVQAGTASPLAARMLVGSTVEAPVATTEEAALDQEGVVHRTSGSGEAVLISASWWRAAVAAHPATCPPPRPAPAAG